MENIDKIKERVKKRRIELEMSYQDLSDKVGINKSTLQRYETGYIRNLSIEKIELLADALEVTPSYLMGWEVLPEKRDKAINKRLGTIISYEKITLDEFCKRIGMSDTSYIKDVLSEKDFLYDDIIDKICDEFRITKEWLIYGSGSMYLIDDFDIDNYEFTIDTPLKYYIIYINKSLNKFDKSHILSLKTVIDSYLMLMKSKN